MDAKLLRGARLLQPSRAVGSARRRFLTAVVGRSSSALSIRAETASGRKVQVEFRLPKKLQYGSSAYLVGNAKGLGEWNAERSQSMTWTDGDVWQSVLEVEPGETLEYKYVVKREDGEDDEWQSCGNQTLQVEEGFRCVVITDNWKGAERGRDVAVERLEEGGEQGSLKAKKSEEEKRQQEEVVMQLEPQEEDDKQQQQQQQEQEPVEELAEELPLVPVHFRVRKQLDYGHMLRMVGGCEQMGSWELGRGLQMEWTNGDLWRAKAYVLPGEVLEYKYVVVDSGGTYEEWQDGFNKQLLVEEGSASVQVKDSWQVDGNSHSDVTWGPVTDKPPQELLQRLKEAKEAKEAAAAAEEAAAKAAVAAAAAKAAAAEEAAAKAAEAAAVAEAAAAQEAEKAAVKAAAAQESAVKAAAAQEDTAEAVEAIEEVAAPHVNGAAAPLNGEAVESPEVALAAEKQENKQEEKEQQVFDIVTPSGRLMANMTVKELKAELKDLGLRTVGRKAELVVRLSEFLSSQDEM